MPLYPPLRPARPRGRSLGYSARWKTSGRGYGRRDSRVQRALRPLCAARPRHRREQKTAASIGAQGLARRRAGAGTRCHAAVAAARDRPAPGRWGDGLGKYRALRPLYQTRRQHVEPWRDQCEPRKSGRGVHRWHEPRRAASGRESRQPWRAWQSGKTDPRDGRTPRSGRRGQHHGRQIRPLCEVGESQRHHPQRGRACRSDHGTCG